MDAAGQIAARRQCLKAARDTLGPRTRCRDRRLCRHRRHWCSSRPRAATRSKILAALDEPAGRRLDRGRRRASSSPTRLPSRASIKGGINRVILATDGDFNVGITDTDELKSFVERKREEPASSLGAGLRPRQLQRRDDAEARRRTATATAAYIDTLQRGAESARRGARLDALSRSPTTSRSRSSSTPQTVSEYRLIGYETRCSMTKISTMTRSTRAISARATR